MSNDIRAAAVQAPDEYHTHEALHVAHVLQNMVAHELTDHPFITAHPAIAQQVEAVQRELGKLYQDIGAIHFPDGALAAAPAPMPDASEVKRVLGYLRTDEAQLRSAKVNAAWADTMARATDLIRALAASPSPQQDGDAEMSTSAGEMSTKTEMSAEMSTGGHSQDRP